MLFLGYPRCKQRTDYERAHGRFAALMPGAGSLPRCARILVRKTHARARLKLKKSRNGLQQPQRVRPTTDINNEKIVSPAGEVRHYAPVIFQSACHP
jgi:hypothetical protein